MVVGAHSFSTPEASRADITLGYQFPIKWLLVEVATQQRGDARSIIGLYITSVADSLENLSGSRLVGKGALQYLALACGIGSLLFTFYVAARFVRAKNLKVKWLWTLITLIGAGRFAVNWQTGEWTYQLIFIQIPCIIMTRSTYGPWVIGASVPAGAIAFLQHRWRRKVTGLDSPSQLTAKPSIWILGGCCPID